MLPDSGSPLTSFIGYSDLSEHFQTVSVPEIETFDATGTACTATVLTDCLLPSLVLRRSQLPGVTGQLDVFVFESAVTSEYVNPPVCP